MNILAINGSSRPFGNNHNLLNTYLESFNKNDNTTEIIQLSDLQIQGCKSCYSCKSNSNQCIIEDDMTIITKKVLESDLLIMAMLMNSVDNIVYNNGTLFQEFHYFVI